MRFIPSLVITLGLAFGSHTARAEGEEPSRGTGKIVGGIIATSVGATVGGIVLLLGMSGASLVDCHDDENCESAEAQGRTTLLGAGIMAGGIGAGVPLIVSGARDRKAWKAWKSANSGDEANRDREGSGIVFKAGIAPVRRGAAATLALEF